MQMISSISDNDQINGQSQKRMGIQTTAGTKLSKTRKQTAVIEQKQVRPAPFK